MYESTKSSSYYKYVHILYKKEYVIDNIIW